jgi:hypothetical protein
MALQYAETAEQEASLVSEDVDEVPTKHGSRVLRSVAAVAGVAAFAGVGLLATSSGTASLTSLRGTIGLDAAEVKNKILETGAFSKYPGYTGDLDVQEAASVMLDHADTTKQDLQWVLKLKGNEVDKCEDRKTLNIGDCGIHITSGEDCSAPGGTGSDFFSGSESPFRSINYNTALGNTIIGQWLGSTAYGKQVDVNTMKTGAQLLGKTVIINDSEGNRAGCAKLQWSDRSSLPPLSPSDLAAATSCFPSDSSANVQGMGAVRLEDLSVGDSVLVRRSSGDLAYEPLLGFLHATKSSSAFMSVQHMGGELRASANHLVFVSDGTAKLASQLQVGDALLIADEGSEKVVQSAVLSVKAVSSEARMLAPLTMAGSIVVDGAVASVYASHSSSFFIPHGAMHALFFPARMLARMTFRTLGVGPSLPSGDAETMHPLASLYARALIPLAKSLSPL